MSDENHNETNPKSGFIGEAAQAVAQYCLLPDPRELSFLQKYFWSHVRPQNYASTDACTVREIQGKQNIYKLTAESVTPEMRKHIEQHAKAFAAAGTKLCQVRDFHDHKDEPKVYQGYRGKDGNCAVRMAP